MNRGFTLLELLMVIGILAILSSVTVLVLNPAQLLAQARDSRRISDVEAISRAMSYYLANTTTPNLGNSANCYVYVSGLGANCGGRHGTRTTTVDGTREIDGAGWIPVDFRDVSGGSPLSVLPIDPKGLADTMYYFSYAPNTPGRTFELDVNMESVKYGNGGPNDVESRDGGNNADIYEIGNDPTLAL